MSKVSTCMQALVSSLLSEVIAVMKIFRVVRMLRPLRPDLAQQKHEGATKSSL